MTNDRVPFIGSGRLQEGGALATKKQDFNAHVGGNGFRHDATNIDMNPVIPLLKGTTVQQTLENLHDVIISAGTGFLSIGSIDGYVQGDYNVGSPETPTLSDTFNAAFTDDRLKNGGVILLLSGTYHLRATVTIPAGVSLLGEVSGTIVIGEMQEVPMFIIRQPTNSLELVTGTPIDTGSNVGLVRLSNLILADNLDGYVIFGEPTMTTTPMIMAEISSNLICENVSFIGRVHTGATPRTKTQAAIGYTGSGSAGTTLKVIDCYLDGLRNGILFTPNHSTLDFLTIDHCKARIFGTEDGAAQDISLNSFLVCSHCNATITNNYIVGAGTYVNTLMDITSGGGEFTKIIMIGNTGSPNSTDPTVINLIKDATGTGFNSIITGNDWDSFTVSNIWYIVIGGGTNSSSLGDFNGSRAVDLVLNIAKTIPSFEAVVIVHPGTYSIRGTFISDTFANLMFIGKKHGKNYPIFDLNLDNFSFDGLNNAPIGLGNHLESIQFISSGKTHSVSPGFNTLSPSLQSSAHLLEVIDCLFINTSLYVLDLGSPPPWKDINNTLARTSILVKDCYFFQDGTFDNTIGCVLPLADQVNLENCFFTGNGYALSIGSNGYTVGNASLVSNVNVSNSIFDLTGYSITTQNSLTKSYLYVDKAASLNMKNCQVYADNQYNNVTPISGSVTDSLTQPFKRFVYLNGLDVVIDDCVFVGPFQSFTVSSVAYSIATLFLEPKYSAKITNSKFVAGSLLLQVGGTSLTDTNFSDGVIIENCFFKSTSQTLVDFDLYLSLLNVLPHVVVKGCNFIGANSPNLTFHTNAANTLNGMIQMLVGDCMVSFIDNNVQGTINPVGSIKNYGALVVNNYDTVGGPGDQVNTAVINDNTFYIINNFSDSGSISGSSCILCRSAAISLQNNLLGLWNLASPSSSFIGCLVLDNPVAGSAQYSDSIVSGNKFTRFNPQGVAANLVRGYVQISANSTKRGKIVDNSFDSITINGSSKILVEDNTTNPNKWTVSRNKNQTASQTVIWSNGAPGISSGSIIGNYLIFGSQSSSSVIFGSLDDGRALLFHYLNTGTEERMRWAVSLNNVIPPDAILVSYSYSYQSTAVPGTTGTISLEIIGNNNTETDTHTITATTLVSNTVNLTGYYPMNASDHVQAIFTADINHSGALFVTLTDFIVTYKW